MLLSKIIESINKEQYSNTLEHFYKKLKIEISFNSNESRFISGWGDGEVVTDPVNYLKFISLSDVSSSFFLFRGGEMGNFRHYSGFVPLYETLACFNDQFKVIYFSKGCKKPLKTDLITDILGN